MMEMAVKIIAVCELVRIIQNSIQLSSLLRDTKARDDAYSEFVKSLKATDKEFVKRMLEEFEESHGRKTEERNGRN